MITMEEAAKSVGLSDRQLRRRIEVCRPLLAPYIRRGDKNRLLLDHGAVEVLRAVEDRRAMGATLEESMAYVADSIEGEQGSELEPTSGQTRGQDSPWLLVIAAKDETIEALKAENAHLRSEIERLMPLALPAPRRGLLAMFRRRRVTA